MRGLFVTGTDTGVGKTELTAALAARWRREGRPFRVAKPVATGAQVVSGGTGSAGLLSDDTQRLAEAAGESDPSAVTPWAFEEPAAPSVAARRAGAALDVGAIAAWVRGLGRDGAAALVEGVGGLLCPLNDGLTVADLAAAVGLPLLVVARRGLGTLNHTLLTLEVARSRGLRVAGVVLSATTPGASVAEETAATELIRFGAPVLLEVPYGGAATAVAGVDFWALAAG